MILAGDVGGTKILLEVGEMRSGRWESMFAERYASVDVVTFPALLEKFLAAWDEVKPSRARITGAGFGVAGPSQNNKAKMTHRPWAVDGDAIARRLAIPQVRVVNDLAAAASGVDLLKPTELSTIQPAKAQPNEARVVIGVGTGMGVAYLVPSAGGGYQVVPGEGGHMSFGPASHEQSALWHALFASRGRVECEDVVSGNGIANIHEFLTTRLGAAHATTRLDPAVIGQRAFEKSDPLCVEAMELFAECLGNIAGDHALAVMARGGVYLAGGVVAKCAPALKSARFRSAFCAKGAFSSLLMKIPVRAVTTERLILLGAAAIGSAH